MVEKLFKVRPPREADSILDPGCGNGAFIEGIIRYCKYHRLGLPKMIGVESDPAHVIEARELMDDNPSVIIRHKDFLGSSIGAFDFIIGNPPYIPITRLSEEEKRYYRAHFKTAQYRFDLYLLFFERALESLKPDGRLVFITPEKFLYTETATSLRKILASMRIDEIELIKEETFGELITYPTITSVVNSTTSTKTQVIHRDGCQRLVDIPIDGTSWLPVIRGAVRLEYTSTLDDTCVRISCGVATGADSVFVQRTEDLTIGLREFARPTLAGRDIDPSNGEYLSHHSMLLPYNEKGVLVPEEQLGSLREYLVSPDNHDKLMKRTCVKRKPWYAFHENPPLKDILRPKIMCKDISRDPVFVIDRNGDYIPRHSVYYIIPKDVSNIEEMARYLNSQEAGQWLSANCQRAANGFLRLQSQVLKRLPVPESLVNGPQQTLNTDSIDTPVGT